MPTAFAIIFVMVVIMVITMFAPFVMAVAAIPFQAAFTAYSALFGAAPIIASVMAMFVTVAAGECRNRSAE